MIFTLAKSIRNASFYPDLYDLPYFGGRDVVAHRELVRILEEAGSELASVNSDEVKKIIENCISNLYPLLDPSDSVTAWSSYKYYGNPIDVWVREELKEQCYCFAKANLTIVAIFLLKPCVRAALSKSLTLLGLGSFCLIIAATLVAISCFGRILVGQISLIGSYGPAISCLKARERLLRLTQTYNEKEKKLLQTAYNKAVFLQNSSAIELKEIQLNRWPNVISYLYLLKPRDKTH